MHLRPMTPADATEVAELIYASINVWYRDNGHPGIQFGGGPGVTEVFFETYDALAPGATVIAVNPASGRIMGSCFFHPRPTHVGLGIMNVHPNSFGRGVAKALLPHLRLHRRERPPRAASHLERAQPRLVRALLAQRLRPAARLPGHVGAGAGGRPRRGRPGARARAPRHARRRGGHGGARARGLGRVEGARLRARDRERAGVLERGRAGRRLGRDRRLRDRLRPCRAEHHRPARRSGEAAALALVAYALDLYPGRAPLVLVPVEQRAIIEQLYAWGARISELHFCQVRGAFQPFRGVSMPTFMLETA